MTRRSASAARGAALGALAASAIVLGALAARAQTRLSKAPRAASGSEGPSPADLRARFGTDLAVRLLRSADPDERLRGLERVAASATPEALALLERASRANVPGAADGRPPLEGVARTDPRALLAAVRGLAAWVDREPARAALASIVAAPTQSFAIHGPGASADPSLDEAEGAARVVLARQQAAMALAESGNALALEALVAIARSAGAGQGPALDALAIHPPATPLLGGVVLTTPATIALAADVGDLRSLDSIEAALGASDPSLRAAALAALGVAGDARAAPAARSALLDRDARVRVAAADTLVRLGAFDSPAAVEALIADDATALDGLRLAQSVSAEGVTKAAAARAAVSAAGEIRAAAIAALGRQAGAPAIDALEALAADPALQGDAACAIARSPSSAAMAAIERIGAVAPLRRLAARAYLVRRLVRGEPSDPLDALLGSLARASDARDRAVGVQALVSLGLMAPEPPLADPDARVRRAAAMGAGAVRAARSRAALALRMAVERDEATSQVLAIGLVDADDAAAATVPTEELARRAREGGPDAPLAAFALASRASGEPRSRVEALLSSADPLLRAHAARGLGASGARDAAGRLARAYAYEADVQARRAIVAALGGVHARAVGAAAISPAPAADRAVPSLAAGTLELAARLDPDRIVRWTAARALSGAPAAEPDDHAEVAWVRLSPALGATMPRDLTAALVDSRGVARPIAFDDDGYAVLAGLPSGDAQLRLAPRPPAYDAAPR